MLLTQTMKLLSKRETSMMIALSKSKKWTQLCAMIDNQSLTTFKTINNSIQEIYLPLKTSKPRHLSQMDPMTLLQTMTIHKERVNSNRKEFHVLKSVPMTARATMRNKTKIIRRAKLCKASTEGTRRPPISQCKWATRVATSTWIKEDPSPPSRAALTTWATQTRCLTTALVKMLPHSL